MKKTCEANHFLSSEDLFIIEKDKNLFNYEVVMEAPSFPIKIERMPPLNKPFG